jgi:hypothetical protein
MNRSRVLRLRARALRVALARFRRRVVATRRRRMRRKAEKLNIDRTKKPPDGGFFAWATRLELVVAFRATTFLGS